MNIEPFFPRAEEKPLDTLVGDGGLCGVFRTIGCVGDSLSSGEFESLDASGNKTYHDMFEYSWGQYLARMAGLTARNFSRGGMTAKEYCESFAEANGYWNPDLACQGYILALGRERPVRPENAPGLAGRREPKGLAAEPAHLCGILRANRHAFARNPAKGALLFRYHAA